MAVIFQKSGLPFQQHTVMATLIGRAPNFSNGLEDGCISIQRIRYTIPGGSSSGSSKVGVAVGAAVGGVALVVACILLWIYIKRRNRLNNSGRRPNSLDGESLPPHLKDKTASPGIVATPFEWAGPGSQFYSRSDGHSTVVGNPPSVTHGLQPPNAPVTPSTMVSSHPTGSGMYPPGPRSTSSGSGGVNPAAGYSDAKQRESMMTGYGVSNPTENVPLSPRTGNLPDPAVGRRSTSGQGSDDVALVDRIAHRLADIMQTRSGGVGVMDQIVPPPVYTDPNAGRASSHSTSPPPTSSPSEYPSAVSPTQLPYAHPGSAQPPYLPYPGAPKY
ncbi:hypothetical protein FRB99_007686 [Tulasnella sp. 403]|nr:hypothetical protein FRB99_007686 [Tulasnella sp. 403]